MNDLSDSRVPEEVERAAQAARGQGPDSAHKAFDKLTQRPAEPPMSRVTPEFEEGFRELCRQQNVEACFVTFEQVPKGQDQVMLKMFSGGHKMTCELLNIYIEHKAAGA